MGATRFGPLWAAAVMPISDRSEVICVSLLSKVAPRYLPESEATSADNRTPVARSAPFALGFGGAPLASPFPSSEKPREAMDVRGPKRAAARRLIQGTVV